MTDMLTRNVIAVPVHGDNAEDIIALLRVLGNASQVRPDHVRPDDVRSDNANEHRN